MSALRVPLFVVSLSNTHQRHGVNGPSTGSGRTGLALVGLICSAALVLSAVPAHAQSVEQRIAAYKHRVDLLEDQNAIENLQATYGYYFDKGLWDQAADLFAPNGSFEYGQRGVYIGRRISAGRCCCSGRRASPRGISTTT